VWAAGRDLPHLVRSGDHRRLPHLTQPIAEDLARPPAGRVRVRTTLTADCLHVYEGKSPSLGLDDEPANQMGTAGTPQSGSKAVEADEVFGVGRCLQLLMAGTNKQRPFSGTANRKFIVAVWIRIADSCLRPFLCTCPSHYVNKIQRFGGSRSAAHTSDWRRRHFGASRLALQVVHDLRGVTTSTLGCSRQNSPP
jgi:hypothetical protein